MATAYKIPGVYVEEIPKFPPSIAPVETAIPAFIGYTEKAQQLAPDDLVNVPTKIGSIAEYEALFGGGYSPAVSGVQLDDNRNFKSASVSNRFFTYDSLRLFYANGGGDCYIVSVATYDKAAKTAAEFTGTGKGINTLEKVDEPTILVMPDTSLLTTGADFYDVYKQALTQCTNLMDRVALLHVKEDDPKGDNFRSGIGINDLKYGAVYTPWVEVTFQKSVSYRAFKDVIFVGGSNYRLGELTTDTETRNRITAYEAVLTDGATIASATTSLAGTGTLRDKYKSLVDTYRAGRSLANFTPIPKFLFDIARKVDAFVHGAATLSDDDLKTAIRLLITSTLKETYGKLIACDREVAKDIKNNAYTAQYNVPTAPAAPQWAGIFSTPPGPSDDINENTDVATMDTALTLLGPLFDRINDAWLSGIAGSATETEKKKHDGLLTSFPLYKNIVTGIQNAATTVPPSGAVAGIYAYVDRTRGVWKAPANVSVAGIVGPTATFTASELAALNVDANSGKSINAIRSFTGKGTLVFGARTLAGNDNEWRYVNVRRFFNFVEESVKKATEQFVFESNDANTWVKLQGMIENFLTTLWRQGALQGAKPEHAFYVAVGLGKTMTPQDILEGRLIIEVGMAAVRPAEFIILRFSHKLAES